MNIRNALSATIVAATMMVTGAAYAETVQGVFNTGQNGTGKLGPGATDTHYTVGGQSTVVFSNPNYITSDNAQFIAQSAGGQQALPTTRYSTTFDLTGYNLNSVSLTGQFAADNYAYAYLNSVSNATLIGFTKNGEFGYISATGFGQDGISGGFLSGINTLFFDVTNTGGNTTASNPAGLFVTGLTVTANRAVPGPIAGAGLPVLLGLAGVAFVRRRRMAA